MILWPAIDILDGRAVRLTRGEFGSETTYHADPLEAASRWVAEGARALHVVDLDGARNGTPANLEHLKRMAAATQIPIQWGGGLRTRSSIAAALAAGASRVVLGTSAYRDPELFDQALADHGEQLVVALDVRAGRLSAAGWTEDTDLSAEDFAQQLTKRGARRFIYSAIDRDGLLEGPDLDAVRRTAVRVEGELVYSGGIAALEDLKALAALAQPKLAGVIVGKALYERRFALSDAQAALLQQTRTPSGKPG